MPKIGFKKEQQLIYRKAHLISRIFFIKLENFKIQQRAFHKLMSHKKKQWPLKILLKIGNKFPVHLHFIFHLFYIHETG
jgi:hypothetical protein